MVGAHSDIHLRRGHRSSARAANTATDVLRRRVIARHVFHRAQ